MKINDVPEVRLDPAGHYTPKKTPSANPLKTPTSGQNFNEDIISISDEAKDLLAEKQNLLNDLKDKSDYYQQLFDHLEDVSSTENPYMDHIKCLEIAMRIISGDKVPSKDERFLMENEPQMYSRALLLRRQKDVPKEYRSLLDDDKNNIIPEDSRPVDKTTAIVEATIEIPTDGESSTESEH